MRKIKRLFAIVAVSLPMLASCGSGKVGGCRWSKIHLWSGYDLGRCYEIEDLRQVDGGIEIDLDRYGHIFLADGSNYILVEDTCPICNR